MSLRHEAPLQNSKKICDSIYVNRKNPLGYKVLFALLVRIQKEFQPKFYYKGVKKIVSQYDIIDALYVYVP